ncbi:MAG: ABC transporter ATP-binding protein [Lachnospiraceae bacterium]|jgi:ATP-binding cassette subfamily B protein|nr:ABC transporter ATP-binding protein [Lachnospiraceae bacterium]
MKNQNQRQKKQVLSAVRKLYRRSLSWNPWYMAMLAGRVGVETLRPLPAIIFPAFIMDALLRGDEFDRIVMLIFAMAGSTFLLSMLDIWSGKRLALLQSGFKDYLNALISEKQLHLALEKTESVEVRELFIKANSAVSGELSYAVRTLGGARGADAIGTETVNLISGLLRAAALILALLSLGPAPVLIILIVLIFHMTGGNRERRASYEERVKTAPYRNKNQYVTNVMIDFRKAKEIRLYRLQDFLLDKFRKNKGYFYQAREEAKPAFYFSHGLGILGEMVQTAVTYGYLVAGVLKGTMTIGGFTGYAAALNNLSATLVTIVEAYLNIHLYGEYFIDFEAAMELEEEGGMCPSNRHGPAWTESEREAVQSIVFEEVSFSYPGSERKALDHVSVEIPLKGSLSIVGQNGSGKSTLVKLLLRLYRPDEGRILLNGTDIWEIPLEEYRKRAAAVFQDYWIFALDIRHNVAPDGGEDRAIWESLKKAGVESAVRNLPGQLDTPLFGYYHENGVDLSGGEKQKLAIARMVHKDAGIMILDEPTAALDPQAELEIYEQVHRLAEDKAVLYISHRMSSCHFSDAILVLEDGKVAEYGSHKELMERRALYYELYCSQAECYKGGKTV